MILYNQGLEYWKIAKRCREHRATNPAIVPTAVRDMQRLLGATSSQAVSRRIATFIRANSPSNIPPNAGPATA